LSPSLPDLLRLAFSRNDPGSSLLCILAPLVICPFLLLPWWRRLCISMPHVFSHSRFLCLMFISTSPLGCLTDCHIQHLHIWILIFLLKHTPPLSGFSTWVSITLSTCLVLWQSSSFSACTQSLHHPLLSIWVCSSQASTSLSNSLLSCFLWPVLHSVARVIF
jgi:hypothetical protein